MGFDLTAKDRSLGEHGYFRLDIYGMLMLRAAMRAAGVSEKLLYRKFLSNDGFLVTQLQAMTIAESLSAWLKCRNLIVDLAEDNQAAKTANEAVFQLVLELDPDRKKKTFARHLLKGNSLPFRIDAGARKMIRQFSDFCRRSRGFWVE